MKGVTRLAGALCVLVALSASVAHADMLASAQLDGKKVLFVVGDAQKRSDDDLIRKHLQELGLTVTMSRTEEPAATISQHDLIVISSTVNEPALHAAYRDVPRPVLTWNVRAYAGLGMTGSTEEVDFGLQGDDRYAYCVDPTHPIARAAGLPGEIFNTTHFDHLPLSWGKPSVAAEVVAIIRGDPNKAGIFTYEESTTMADGQMAPARRAGFYLSDANFHQLTRGYGPAEADPSQRSWFVGKRLFDATVRWAMSPSQATQHAPDQLHERLRETARGKKVLYVQRFDAPPAAAALGDKHTVDYLRSLGFEVTVVDQMEPDTHAIGKDLVIIASTVGANRFGTRYQRVAVPVLASEAIILPYLRMSGLIRRIDFFWDGEGRGPHGVRHIDIVNSAHVASAGIAPGVIPIYSVPGSIKWGRPLQGASVIATLPNRPDKAAIFGYRKGATMNLGFTAPARRAFFFVDNGMFDHLTREGRLLYDATLLWSLQSDDDEISE